jgi:23S rRNA (cytosine1962-C5)-methyltransferase
VLERFAADGREFDLVILDPPSFAQNAASVPNALEAYERLARLGIRLTAPGGTLVQASCSSRVDVDQLAEAMRLATRGTGRRVRERRRTAHPIDHPIGFAQGGYLKALYVEVAASVAGTKN